MIWSTSQTCSVTTISSIKPGSLKQLLRKYLPRKYQGRTICRRFQRSTGTNKAAARLCFRTRLTWAWNRNTYPIIAAFIKCEAHSNRYPWKMIQTQDIRKWMAKARSTPNKKWQPFQDHSRQWISKKVAPIYRKWTHHDPGAIWARTTGKYRCIKETSRTTFKYTCTNYKRSANFRSES